MKTQNRSIYTKYQSQTRNSRDGGGKQLKRRKVFATVTDMQHGIHAKGAGLLPQVRVPVPATKREKYSGSPFKS